MMTDHPFEIPCEIPVLRFDAFLHRVGQRVDDRYIEGRDQFLEVGVAESSGPSLGDAGPQTLVLRSVPQ